MLFEHWEIEELTCVALFFERKCKAMATALERDLEADGANSQEGLLARPRNPLDFTKNLASAATIDALALLKYQIANWPSRA